MIRSGVRSTGERGIGVFLVASLMLHAGALAFFLFHRKPLSLGYQTATTVALIPENQLAPESAPPPAPPAPPQKKIAPPPPPPPPPRPVHRAPAPRVIHRAPVPKPVRKPVRRPVKKVKRKAPAKKSPLRKTSLKRKALAPSKVTKESTRKLQSAKAAPAAVSNPVPVHMDLAGTHFPSYLQHLLIARIKSNWSPPPGSHGRSVTVSFTLRKNGELDGDPVLVTRSGSQVFDDAARYAILRSVPFPPFPPSYGKEKEAVTVTLQATKRQGF